MNQGQITDAIKICKYIEDGKANRTVQTPNYSETVKPKIESFKNKYTHSPNKLLGETLKACEIDLREEYAIKSFQFYGRQLNNFVWACIYCNYPEINETPASYSPQLYIVLRASGIKFGLDYGDYLNNESRLVSRVLDYDNIIEEIISVSKSIPAYNAGKLGANLYNEEGRISLNSKSVVLKNWNHKTHIINQLRAGNIPQNAEDIIKGTIKSLYPLFDKICQLGLNADSLEKDDYVELRPNYTPFTKIPEELSGYTICKALLSKPFAILTGASGTGKTKLATSLAKYLSNADGTNSEVVAVGADWTDNRNVLGFVNHLRTIKAGGTELPIYQSTSILDLILEASKCENKDVPFFLILDEMNLSHVERYFADFLSAMEQDDGVLELHEEGEACLPRNETDATRVPHQIAYPKNLFVIGTVNIDETTYMFSPKVLDRANVIEFTVTDTEIEAFLKDPKPYAEPATADQGVAEGFFELAKKARHMEGEAFEGKLPEDVSSHMLDLFKILQAGRFEFAYRTAKEINIYLRICRHLAGDKAAQKAWDDGGWKSDLDDQILQKLLPKLHGSVSRIDTLLANLADYCHNSEYKENGKVQPDLVLQLKPEEALFGKSLKKLQMMLKTLKVEQFVSFIQ